MSIKSRLICVFLFILCLAPIHYLAAASTPACVVPPSNLVSWWTGDSDENDLYTVNDPSAVNAVTLVPAEVSNGFQFGTGAYIDIPFSKSLALQKFTWAGWVKPLGPGPNNDSFGSVITEQNIDDSDVSVALLWRANPDDRFLFLFGNVSAEQIISTDKFPSGTFYFVAATYDGATFRLYVNGVLEGSFAETKKIGYPTRTWEIGSADATLRSLGYPRTLNGVIDELQVYSTALPAARITALYKAGSSGTCKAAVIVTPASETFAAQSVGTTSPAKNVTVLNNRNTEITLGGVTFSGTNKTDFAEGTSTCGSSLGPRKSCKIPIMFTPQVAGKRIATLSVSDSATGNPQNVALTGTGK